MEGEGCLHGWEKLNTFSLFALQDYQAGPANVKTWYVIGPLYTGPETCNLNRRLKDSAAGCLSAQTEAAAPTLLPRSQSPGCLSQQIILQH